MAASLRDGGWPSVGSWRARCLGGDAGPSLYRYPQRMDQNAFYGVISAINFTLLGLWWVAVKDRTDVVSETASGRLTAYLVSLQFVILGTVSLLAQIAPDAPLLWRTSFAVAGIVGGVGIVKLSRELRMTTDAQLAPTLFLAFGLPIYIAVVAVAVLPMRELLPPDIAPIQVEAFLVSLLVFLGVQEAWIVSMTPPKKQPTV